MVVDAGGGGGGSLLSSLTGALDALDDLGEAAGEFFVSQAEYLSVRKALQDAVNELKNNPMETTPALAFGNSWGGAEMARQTQRAEAHVIRELQDLTDGLVDYRDAINDAERRAVDSDGNVAEWLTRLARSPHLVDGSKIAEGMEDIENA